MSAWVLPDDVADALPSAARHIEELRRQLLDVANRFGYELVIPPLIEYTDSLLSGAGSDLDLLTFKLVDQLSGRAMGVRADTTPQVARIDAHLLNRKGVTRLCYAGPVLHTRSDRPYATREPLQFGAEVYGHIGLDSDVEVVDLAVTCLQQVGVVGLRLDIADVRLVEAILLLGRPSEDGAQMHHKSNKEVKIGLPQKEEIHALHRALAAKDAASLTEMLGDWLARDWITAQAKVALMQLPRLYGDVAVLDLAQACFAPLLASNPNSQGAALLKAAFADLREIHTTISAYHPHVEIGFDLSDLQGYDYYTALRFALYASGAPDSVARGGRYDEVGAAFGRRRPAAGFSLDIKELLQVVKAAPLKGAIRAPWGADAQLHRAVVALRLQGETVVCLPQESWEAKASDEIDEFYFDRCLVKAGEHWTVQAL